MVAACNQPELISLLFNFWHYKYHVFIACLKRVLHVFYFLLFTVKTQYGKLNFGSVKGILFWCGEFEQLWQGICTTLKVHFVKIWSFMMFEVFGRKKLTECNWIMQWRCDWQTSVVCFIVRTVDLPCLTDALHFVYGIQRNLTQICTWDEGISSEFCVNVVIH